MFGIMRGAGLWLFLVFLLTSCDRRNLGVSSTENDSTENFVMDVTGKDKHSFSRPEEALMTHLALELEVSFEKKLLKGIAHVHFKNKGVQKLLLDTHDLCIEKVEDNGKPLSFRLHEKIEHLGSALEIDVSPETSVVSIHYQTSPEAQALQWLAPDQTAGKKFPFLYTQSQPHLARSWIPCQDSPGIRFTYQARVKVPKQYLALMSATNPQTKNNEGVYDFRMNQPIPAYLIALAVGDIDFKSVGERTGVYAEPPLLAKAVKEFEDMEKMLQAAEKLYGVYRWERYDVLVMPPSFPFGGMENPRLTFATPTILAGDKSLVSLIAHELAHSWSGNLVTNATWEDLWLNEGFTVYFENRIMEEIYGESVANMLALISYKELQEELQTMQFGDDTKLKINLSGRNPDEGITGIAYEKGFFFLKLLEEKIGRPQFDAFLREYFEQHAFQSMDTERFLRFLRTKLLNTIDGIEGQIEVEKWVYGNGLPDNCPKIFSDKFELAFQEAKNFEKGTPADKLATRNWTYQQWIHFLTSLSSPLSHEQLASLDKAFKFTQSGNSEILFVWLKQCIRSNYSPVYPIVSQFLGTVGRRKFVVPLYEELLKQKFTVQMAKNLYQKYRSNYHYLTAQRIDRVFEDML